MIKINTESQMSQFNKKYYSYKKQYLISEGTIRNLYPELQRDVFSYLSDRLDNNDQYFLLTDQQKQLFDQEFKRVVKLWKDKIESTTDNKQYQSWLYNRIADDMRHVNDIQDWTYFILNRYSLHQIKQMFKDFTTISKSPKVSKEQKNIMNYDSIDSLFQFIKPWLDQNTKNTKLTFAKVYSNDYYDIYAVGLNDKELFQKIYGPLGYDVGWCNIDPEQNMFEHYLTEPSDCYYLWTYKGTNKPFALLHFDSGQFKDIHNQPITTKDNKSPNYFLSLLEDLYYLHTNGQTLDQLQLSKEADLNYFKELLDIN